MCGNDGLEFEIPNGFQTFVPKENPDKLTNNFRFFISDDNTIIYKKVFSTENIFSRLLEDVDKFLLFERILSNDFFDGAIKKHIVCGFELEKDGSYKSKFIEGYRLDLLANESPPVNIQKKILDQCKILIDALDETDRQGNLCGDWALHNLIYSVTDDCIFNVDLEGFVTYNPLPEWANMEHIRKWLGNL